MDPLIIGVVGAGAISRTYLRNLPLYGHLRIGALADLDLEQARAVGSELGIETVLTTEDLLAHPDIDIVLNLTSPHAHAEIAFAAVSAGKHVYNEKPLAVEFADARTLLAEAERQGVSVGGAPDTFLGAGHQEVRALIDSGRIGTVVSATGVMVSGGSESWHPDPRFHYKRGGGPLFVMGPYYLTAMVNVMGPIRRVSGSATIVKRERTILSQPRRGEVMTVETPTNVAALLEFESGAVATLTTSYDVPVQALPHLVFGGDAGTLVAPDPNHFSGPIRSRRAEEADWTEHTYDRPYASESRGVGVADMAFAIQQGRPTRADGRLALHVLEAMHAVLRSAQSGRHVRLETSVPRPEPLVGSVF